MKYLVLLILCPLFFPQIVSADESLVVLRAKKEIKLTGFTRKKNTAIVSSEVSGKVIKVNYDVGQTIQKQPFIEIDPTFITLKIDITRKSIERSGILQKKLRRRISYLEKEFIRIESLHRDELTTEDKRDRAKYDLDDARIELESINLEKEKLKINLRELIEQKMRHNIYVLEGWKVIEKMVEEGEFIQSGAPLGKAANYRELVVPLSVSNNELNAIKALPEIFNSRIEGRPVQASINWINPEFDEKSRKRNIELIIKDYTGEKRGGLLFTLLVYVDTEGLLIPKEAVTSRYDNPRVTLKKT